VTFSRIYRNNEWGNPESRSGSGSTLEATKNIRAALPELLANLQIACVLDIPCGDFNWQKELDWDGTRYIGADIVPELIEANRAAYPERDFRVLDLARDELPQADLVICRDCLVHLSFEDCFKALENICKSGAKYLLTTTFPLHRNEEDIQTGEGWRPVNLCEEPFPLGDPALMLNEGCVEPFYWDKCAALWRIEN